MYNLNITNIKKLIVTIYENIFNFIVKVFCFCLCNVNKEKCMPSLSYIASFLIPSLWCFTSILNILYFVSLSLLFPSTLVCHLVLFLK